MKKSEQQNLGFDYRKESGPVECLGMTFENDDKRRAYFIEKLREKLQDPEFRNIEGFPIGEDEDIIALSNPPYYTACPNPFLEDFIKHYGKPFKVKEKYHREPFAADVKEGKNHPIYNAHSYHTKVPHKAIMRYILNYTEPGDIVFDGFCGTGMTGVAAKLCEDKFAVQDLGYRIGDDKVYNEESKFISEIGLRHAILNDLSPIATYIASIYNASIDTTSFAEDVEKIVADFEDKYAWLYMTLHNASEKECFNFSTKLKNCKSWEECQLLFCDKKYLRKALGNPGTKTETGKLNYVVWSDVFICPDCGEEIIFYNVAVDPISQKVSKIFSCPKCTSNLTKSKLDRAFITFYDEVLKTTKSQTKQIPVLINYSIGKKKLYKKPDLVDLTIIKKIDSFKISHFYPSERMPAGDESRRNDDIGLTHVHHFYYKRSLLTLSFLLEKSDKLEGYSRKFFARFLFQQWAVGLSKLNRFSPHHFSQNNRNLSGTLYVGSQISEVSPRYAFTEKTKRLVKAFQDSRDYRNIIETRSATELDLNDNSVDYIFVDPPFGGNLMYSELNFFWEAWLKIFTNAEPEAITNKTQGKKLPEYQLLMLACFREFYRILKPGRWITVEFSNTRASVWNSLQTTLQESGFVIANIAALDKMQRSFKAVNTPTAVKQDLIISAYKPNGGLEKRFLKKAETEEGVWDFIQSHLKNLPVVKPKGGQLEFITERDPRILYDRTVAYYVQHGFPVPISSPEFQIGLADKFPERDGMYFLPDQAAEYDKKRLKMEGLGQMTIWVEDERSAADWLRNFLKNKPSKYQEIQPEFFEKLNEAWKKWETRPELRALLDQYFLCYDGKGNVPPQIHSYLSTNFKELRKLPADDPSLRSKAKDRWYVPDPRKNADVEKLREKRLLDEFWTYLPPGYDLEAIKRRVQSGQETLPGFESPPPKIPKGKRLKLVRTEAVRVGFKQCYQIRDYQTIIAVAHYIPEDVVNGDDQLQMIYDSAVTRSGLEI